MTEYDKVIHPGGVGKVSASIHTASFKGDVVKSVTVTTNDPDHPTTVLQLRATITVAVDVQPDTLSLDGRAGEIAPVESTITAVEGEAFDVVAADFNQPGFTATIVPVADESGKAPPPAKPKAGTIASGSRVYKLTVTADPELAIGRTSATLTLKTTHPKAAEVPVRIFANVRGDVEFVPERVTFRLGASAPEAGKVQHVSIRRVSPTGDPLLIKDVKVSNPGFKTKVVTVAPEQAYDLEIRWDGPPPSATLNETVIVTTNNARQSNLSIGIFALPELQSPANAGVPQPGVQLVPNPKPSIPQPTQLQPIQPQPPPPAKPPHG